VLGQQIRQAGELMGVEEQGAEEGLFGVVQRFRRGQVVVGLVVGGVIGGHQAARVKSSRLKVAPRCGASRWAASRGGTALPIWPKT
jgi:hypothetical protein